MTKEQADETENDILLQKEDQNVVDAENIELKTNQQAANQNMIRNAIKRPPFIRRPSMRKRSYSYSEGHNSGKRFKRGGGGPSSQKSKFLFGGNIRDPLNLNALSKDEIEQGGKSGGILQQKKFEGHSAMPGKRWKRNTEKKKFLLGGNFRDPLNLNSLSDEKIARIANAVTPQSSPIPTPKHRKPEYKIEVLIPPNISDPLNLMSFEEDSNPPSPDLLSPDSLRRRRPKKFENSENSKQKVRFRKRAKSMVDQSWHESVVGAAVKAAAVLNHRRWEADSTEKLEEKTEEVDKESQALMSESVEVQSEKILTEQLSNAETKFVAPEASTKPKKSVTISVPKKSKKFEYGNYNRYYGYRNPGTLLFPGTVEDPRLYHFKPEWFFGKDVLDIGCNVGALTLEIGRRFAPKSLLGIDIDPDLIRVAKKYAENLRDYQVPPSSQPTPIASLSAAATPSRTQEMPSTLSAHATEKNSKNSESVFPQSFPLIYGPLDPTAEVDVAVGERLATSMSATPRPQQTPRTSVNSGGPMNLFGRKVRFLCDNYVLESDELLELAQPEFDTILCLSTTKWMHLNFGDEGIKRAFKRMYAQLRPGGILILEAQGYSSYYKKRKLTPRIHENFQSIQFMPDQFSDFLLQEVGFTTSLTVAVPRHSSRGFQRPIQVFTKMPLLSSRSVGETSSSQNTPYYCTSCGGGCGSSCPATPYSSHTTPYHSCSGSCQATPHYYHHYNTLGSEGETPVHSSMQ